MMCEYKTIEGTTAVGGKFKMDNYVHFTVFILLYSSVEHYGDFFYSEEEIILDLIPDSSRKLGKKSDSLDQDEHQGEAPGNRSFDDTDTWAESKSTRVKSAKKATRVKFSETDELLDITPRERSNSASYRQGQGHPPGGRLRNNKSKSLTDSGSRIGEASQLNDSIFVKSKAKLSLVSVAYLDEDTNEIQMEDGSAPPGVAVERPKAYKRRKAFAQKQEIESQMSRLSLSDEEKDQEEKAGTLETKYTSQHTAKNYYEAGKKEEDPKKTVKTLEFGTAGVEESKTVERVGAQTPQPRVNYQPPRPTAATRGTSARPSSARKVGLQYIGHTSF